MGVVVIWFYRGGTSVVYINISCDMRVEPQTALLLESFPWEQQRECRQGPLLEQGEALKHLINSPAWGNGPGF